MQRYNFSAVNLLTRPDPLPLMVRAKTYQISREYEAGTYSTNTTVPAQAAITFQLSSLPGFADFTSLFDQYRVIQAQLSFIPFQTVCNNVSSHPGFLHTVIDYDDNTVISVVQAEQYDTYKKDSLLTEFSRVLYPRVSASVYLTTLTTGYSMGLSGYRGPWLDAVSSSIPYFGVKFISDGSQSVSAQLAFTLSVRLVCEFRSPF